MKNTLRGHYFLTVVLIEHFIRELFAFETSFKATGASGCLKELRQEDFADFWSKLSIRSEISGRQLNNQ